MPMINVKLLQAGLVQWRHLHWLTVRRVYGRIVATEALLLGLEYSRVVILVDSIATARQFDRVRAIGCFIIFTGVGHEVERE